MSARQPQRNYWETTDTASLHRISKSLVTELRDVLDEIDRRKAAAAAPRTPAARRRQFKVIAGGAS